MMNPFSLAGKTILVTGASSGIGKATAIVCSQMGATVIVTGRNEERLAETFSMLEGEGHQQLIADLNDEEQIVSLVENVPVLDGCVSNAGIGRKGPIAFIKKENLLSVLETNTIAPVLLVRYLVKKKKLNKNASVVFTESISGVYSVDVGNSVYSISKSALDGFMKNAAIELAPKGIRVNGICPGMVETPINSNYTEEQRNADLANYPLKRYGKPEEIAYAAVYLLSETSSWVTGINLRIDGGYCLK